MRLPINSNVAGRNKMALIWISIGTEISGVSWVRSYVRILYLPHVKIISPDFRSSSSDFCRISTKTKFRSLPYVLTWISWNKRKSGENIRTYERTLETPAG